MVGKPNTWWGSQIWWAAYLHGGLSGILEQGWNLDPALRTSSARKSPISETRKWVYASGGYLRSPKTGEIAPCKGKPCLISNFELSGHQFGTILKSFILTFQSASIQPSPIEYCLSRMQETLFQVEKSPGMCFFWKIQPGRAAPHRSRIGDASTHGFDQNPDIQLSKHPNIQMLCRFQQDLIENQSKSY